MLEQRIQQQFFDSADLQYQTAETLSRPIADGATALLGAITGGGKVLVAGSGNAATLALHVARLFTGRFERERPPLPAVALAGGAVAQIRALGQPGDVLLAVDSGDADAVPLRDAVAAAHGKEMTVVLIGSGSVGAAPPLAETDVAIALPPARGMRTLELQLLVLHSLCDAIDLQLLGDQEP